MRKLVAVSLAGLLVLIGIPAVAQAQSTFRAAAVSGQVVDASGRGAVGQRVELVEYGAVMQTTNTTSRGAFTFTSVPSGDYVVRTMVNSTPAGIRVSVNPGVSVTNATIVLPSVAAPSGPPLIGLVFSLGPILGTFVVVAAATAAGFAIVKITGS
jgi:hypothetical protein